MAETRLPYDDSLLFLSSEARLFSVQWLSIVLTPECHTHTSASVLIDPLNKPGEPRFAFGLSQDVCRGKELNPERKGERTSPAATGGCGGCVGAVGSHPLLVGPAIIGTFSPLTAHDSLTLLAVSLAGRWLFFLPTQRRLYLEKNDRVR